MQTILVPLKADRAVTVYSTDDVEPILEHNKTLRGLDQKSDWGRHVASIPNIIMVQWLNQEWQRGSDVRYLSKEWDELVAKKLRDPEWAYLRTDAPSKALGWGQK
jgi:hypothetical protein